MTEKNSRASEINKVINERELFLFFLEFKEQHPLSYEHSVRVSSVLEGLYGTIGCYFGMLHDLGKLRFDREKINNNLFSDSVFIELFNNSHHVPKIKFILRTRSWGSELLDSQVKRVTSAISKHHNLIRPNFSDFDIAAQIADKADRARFGLDGQSNKDQLDVTSDLQSRVMEMPIYRNRVGLNRLNNIMKDVLKEMYKK